MFYFIIACVVMFIASTIVFTLYNKSEIKDDETLYMGLLIAAMASILWPFTIPASIILGGAWLLAKLFSMDWKQKNERETDD